MQVVVGGFIIKKNKFLFGKRVRSKTWAPGKWDIVGGHVKKNETIFNALKRETKEETNITVIHAKLLAEEELMDEQKGELFKYYIFMVLSWKGKADNSSDEHTKLRWFTPRQLAKKKLALPQYLPLIKKFLEE